MIHVLVWALVNLSAILGLALAVAKDDVTHWKTLAMARQEDVADLTALVARLRNARSKRKVRK